jgi:hypothetical protein
MIVGVVSDGMGVVPFVARERKRESDLLSYSTRDTLHGRFSFVHLSFATLSLLHCSVHTTLTIPESINLSFTIERGRHCSRDIVGSRLEGGWK